MGMFKIQVFWLWSSFAYARNVCSQFPSIASCCYYVIIPHFPCSCISPSQFSPFVIDATSREDPMALEKQHPKTNYHWRLASTYGVRGEIYPSHWHANYSHGMLRYTVANIFLNIFSIIAKESLCCSLHWLPSLVIIHSQDLQEACCGALGKRQKQYNWRKEKASSHELACFSRCRGRKEWREGVREGSLVISVDSLVVRHFHQKNQNLNKIHLVSIFPCIDR